jgi:hypothetical protein
MAPGLFLARLIAQVSQTGQKKRWVSLKGMSVLPSPADIQRLHRHARFVPILLQKSVETGLQP